ncbi:NnrU family protein [Frigidibacter sp. MR17.24]|uniref:NnrU family protein n=1 Tax=Frigidibacter sp. MR17.24 TaxID=3127345 RepID=UPI003012E058
MMWLLVLGVVLMAGAHLSMRLSPGLKARLGRPGYGAILLVALVLIVAGYRGSAFTPVYTPIPGIGHLNNLLMLVAVFLFGVGGTKGLLWPRLRNPMLIGTVVWAVAHLLVNGDLSSIVLFGGLGLWALVQIALIDRTPWARPDPAAGRGIRGDAMNLVGTLVLYGLIAGVHIWLGHNPFVGTYF